MFEKNSWNQLGNSSDLKSCMDKMRDIIKNNGSSNCGAQIFYSVKKNTCGCIKENKGQGIGLIRALESEFIEIYFIHGMYCFSS